ncbi:ATP-dependent Clp protease proteolytic subunit [Thermosphaera chiliense]|uniref:ATP-dependent Clp protease proteolytic subunit n=1 Tax=Thermosphaera chiliense TaxID=3402707 RepID=A0A7M1USX2_9CREN|nr:ATP-dependent Clp protease proteolytic subunit [Thermosphaera aggregans]QOR94593.1 ATP-dependent Clp protease proteolytic subunit [Thermosphaera aggregans]
MFDPVSLLFFLLLLYMAVHPQLQLRSLANARLKLIREIERRYGWRVITMIHRQEKIGFLGFPVYRYIDIEDSEAVIRAIRSTPPDQPIALILHTPGGLVLAASQIAMALKKHPGRKVVIVPHYAMSGGTLIALAADEIVMDPDAVLGPLDPQIPVGNMVYPAPSLVKIAKLKGRDARDDILVLADVAEKAIKEIQGFIVKLLEDKLGVEKAREVARALTEGRYTHDYPITVEEARSLGLNVSVKVPLEVYALMSLYPQAIQQRPGVEYLPRPPVPFYQKERREGG